MMTVLEVLLALAVGITGGFVARKIIVSRRLDTAESRAVKLVAEAEAEADTKVRRALIEVKEEISGMRREAEEDLGLRRQEVKRLEERLTKREEGVEAKLAEIQTREQRVERADREMVRQALTELPVPFREILLLCEVEEMSYEEISQVLVIPVGTVMSRLYRARKALRALMVEKFEGAPHGV